MLSVILLQIQEQPAANQFFTTESLVTFAGASAITFVIANGCQRALDFNPKWLALAIAIAVCLLAVYIEQGKGINYLIGVINGFLVYNTAAGATATFGTPNPNSQTTAVPKGNVVNQAQPIQQKRGFLSSWF